MHPLSLRHVRLLLLAAAALFMLTIGPSQTAPANAATPPPRVTRSLSLTGAGHIAVPHSPALNPTASAFTVEAWVRRNDASRCETVVAKGYQTAWWLGFCSGPIRFYASGSAGGSVDGATTIPAGVWTHIAVVYKGSGREYYVNGELDYQGGSEAAPTANTLPVNIGRDPAGYYPFSGRIANVRFWNVARTQEQIRQWMHVATAEPLPGLVANWRLAGDANDASGAHHGATTGTTTWDTTYPPPSQPPSVAVDRTFNTLPWARHGQATVYLPQSNQALLIGGYRGGTILPTIDLIDAATGAVTQNIGSLSAGLTHLGAAYVPTNDTAYTFGGASNTGWTASGASTIYAINPNTGAVRTVAASLPTGANAPLAVYHPGHDKIYIFGGRNPSPLTTISIFDPATETLSTPAGFTLPEALSHIGGAYSTLDGAIYLFGGFTASPGPGGVRDSVYRVDFDPDGLGGAVTLLSTQLPNPGAMMNAVEDPLTRLIYVAGGWGQDWVHAFDPAAQTLWQTQVALPLQRYGSGVIFSPPQRHALLLGGDEFDGVRAVWRIPLGDGPLVATGHWAFLTPVPSAVTAIAGEGNTVAVGTQASGIYRYRSDGSRVQYSAAALGGSGAINDLAYVAAHDHIWAATNAAGGKLINAAGPITTYGSGDLGTNQILSVAPLPGYSSATGAARFGTASQGLRWQRFQFSPGGGFYVWETSFPGAHIRAIAHRTTADLYVLAGDNLARVELGLFGGTETSFGPRCGLISPAALVFGRNWDWWLGSTGVFEFGGAGICNIPASAAPPGAGASVSTLLGNRARDIAVDADNRLWFAMDADPLEDAASGGLAVFEVTPTGIRNREYNWASAPLGSRTANLLGPGSWDSRVTAVGAVEERVWSGNNSGRLVTHAQRWQQLANSNDLASLAVQDVWTARRRLFAATSTSLHVLNPDGATWDNRASGKVWDVLGDSQGRIWVATQTGIRLYTPTDWDYLTDRLGPRPATATYALAEDHDGRIWIGGLHGLTLFDRDRFVATFTSANSGLPATAVHALFVDSNNHLWAGDLAISTAGGLSLYDGAAFATQSLPIPAANLPLSVDEAGRLWAGRAVLQAGAWRVYHSTNSGLRSDNVSGNAADGADRIWFAHGGSGGVSVRAAYLPRWATLFPSPAASAPAAAAPATRSPLTAAASAPATATSP
jgi:hypothetical protein